MAENNRTDIVDIIVENSSHCSVIRIEEFIRSTNGVGPAVELLKAALNNQDAIFAGKDLMDDGKSTKINR